MTPSTPTFTTHCGRSRPVWLRVLMLTSAVQLGLSVVARADEDGEGLVIRVGRAVLRSDSRREAGKVPVVFVHGMLGSPDNWSVMIDRLAADPSVRAHFQLRTFGYNTFHAIPESGRELVEALAEARRRFDPEGRDDSFEHVVLVGHSLGGLVAKAAATLAPGPRPAQAACRPHVGPAGPRVGRVIFVATPHRGTPVDRGVTRSLGIGLARAVIRSTVVPKTGNDASRVRPSTSVDQLTWDNPVLRELERAMAATKVPSHSIIAALCDPSAEGASDSLVPVASARLEGVRSEVMVRAAHACYRHPDVIREVRRILDEHAADVAHASRSGPANLPPIGSLGALSSAVAPLAARGGNVWRNEPPANPRWPIRPRPIAGARSAGQDR